ncbi:AAA family ATPase [Acinetobacter baumannii]|nr:AAA family ATPase [Acinetobacter baumannii]
MKICIVGPSGAGKTTLSKKLEKELNISAYAFDGIYWNLSGTVFIKNSEEIISYGIKQRQSKT